MQTLIEVARKLKRGQRIRIAHYEKNLPRNARDYSPTLTDAQIFAYQDQWVVNMFSPDRKTLFCTIIDPRDYRELLTGVESELVKEVMDLVKE